MEVVPVILGNGRLRLQVQPEVSERDFANSVTIAGQIIPGLTTRRVNTEVEMKFGQTLMIAGLISSRQTADTNKVPFLGELPWLGAAFSRKNYTESETELVILVTPELVAPLEADQVPQGGPGFFTDSPTDRELFWGGLIEVPKYGDECEGCVLPMSMSNLVPPGQLVVPGLMEDGSSAGSSSPPPKPVESSAEGSGIFLPPVPNSEGQQTSFKSSSRSVLNRIRSQNSFSAKNPMQKVRFETSDRLPTTNPIRRRRQKPGLIEPDSRAGSVSQVPVSRSHQLISPNEN